MSEGASAPEPALPKGAAALGVTAYTLVGVLSAAIEVLLIPLYVGSHIFPVTVLAAVVVNYLLPALVRMMVDWRWAVVLPLAGWLVAAIILGFTNTSSGSVLVPGGGADGYVGLALFFIGTLAGFIGVIRQLPTIRLGAGSAGPPAPTGAARR